MQNWHNTEPAEIKNKKNSENQARISIIVNRRLHNGPKFIETCFEVLETSFRARICTIFPKICANFPKICANFPKICANFPKLCTSFPKRFLKNIVTTFFKKFRIYGTPPSPGVYNGSCRNNHQTKSRQKQNNITKNEQIEERDRTLQLRWPP